MSGVPDISVVMSVYNDATTLPAALDSVLSQDGVALECIVVDDGSTDASGAILDAYALRDARLRVVHQANAGLTRALIAGCALARGDWIARQDADDISLPGRLRAQLARARQADAPVLISCRAECCAPEGDPLFCTEPPLDPASARRWILEDGRTLSAHGAMFFERSSYEAVGGYRSEFEHAQDLDLSIRLAENGRVAVVPEVLYRFGFAPGAISGGAGRWQAACRRLILSAREARMAQRSEAPVLLEAAQLGALCRERGMPATPPFETLYFLGACLWRRNPELARGYLWRAVKRRPWSASAWLRWWQALLWGWWGRWGAAKHRLGCGEGAHGH